MFHLIDQSLCIRQRASEWIHKVSKRKKKNDIFHILSDKIVIYFLFLLQCVKEKGDRFVVSSSQIGRVHESKAEAVKKNTITNIEGWRIYVYIFFFFLVKNERGQSERSMEKSEISRHLRNPRHAIIFQYFLLYLD